MEVCLLSNQLQHFTQSPGDPLSKQQSWHQGFERGVCVGMVDAVDLAQVGLVMGGQCRQGLQVVAHDFGSDILNHGLLRQAGDMLQIKPMFESFEGFLTLPAIQPP